MKPPVHNRMTISTEFVVIEKVVSLIGGYGVRKSTKKKKNGSDALF